MADLFSRCSNPCCGYVNLRLASLIGGYLQLLGDLILIGYSIERINFAVHAARVSDSKAVADFTFFFILIFYIEFILFLFIIALLVGIYKRKQSCITAYLITLVICLGFATIIVLYCTIIRTFLAEVFFPGIILIGLLTYYLVVIVNYNKEISSDNASNVRTSTNPLS